MDWTSMPIDVNHEHEHEQRTIIYNNPPPGARMSE